MLHDLPKKIADLTLLFTETTILVLIWGFIIGILRIPYPIVDHLFYIVAGTLITFFVVVIHVVRNNRGGKWGAFFLQVGACTVAVDFWIMYLPGARDFPGLLVFLGAWFSSSVISIILFLRSLIQRTTPNSAAMPAWMENTRVKKKFFVFTTIFLISCGGYATYYFAGTGTYQITVQPQDYTVRVSFWAAWNHSLYTQDQLEDLGNYSTRLYLYNIYPEDHLLPSAPNHAAFVDSLREFKTYNISVMFCPGLGINMTTRAKDYQRLFNVSYSYLDFLDAYPEFDPQHGGNFVGVCADIESAQELVVVNRSEYEQIAVEFETLVDAYHQRGLIYTVATGAYALVDGFDGVRTGDTDLDQLKGLVINGVTNLDVIFWESYRATDHYRPSYSVYSDCAQANAFWGPERGGFWIGITGMANYGCGSAGLNELITDCLVCKNFGFREIGIFILTYWDPAIGNASHCGELDACIEFLQAYGNGALDTLQERVNGANRTQTFSIPFTYEIYSYYSPFFLDLILSLNSWLAWVVIGTWGGSYLFYFLIEKKRPR